MEWADVKEMEIQSGLSWTEAYTVKFTPCLNLNDFQVLTSHAHTRMRIAEVSNSPVLLSRKCKRSLMKFEEVISNNRCQCT
ncbi:hypothetical protein Y1Q_0002703 [Alligator mississippiensis]|uniref:Uncharacterized protein n=1 Tax=Alligator mississippiensis TaxID=8496 RepID=A0A151NYV1_ALLMI|nr:hypothetical protein Y1Q_0002703 [Alligator mississippiensis]